MESVVPTEVRCSGDQIFDIAFHPHADLLAVASITGLVELFQYAGDTKPPLIQSMHHAGSCRGVLFSDDGEYLYSISSDKSWKTLDGRGALIYEFPDAHETAINKITSISAHTIATGDDSGCVRIWDTRHHGPPVMAWKLHEDFVSDFCYNSELSVLLSVSGDATLCAYDLRKSANHFRSDDQESEMTSINIIKHGKKVVCGTQDGVILLFSWGKWGDCSDRYPGHPESVDSILRIDENTILTGSSDGMIRAVSLQPNKIIGIIGDHEEFPVEGMKRSRDNRLLASFAHDEIVRFWDVSMFEDDDGDGDGDEVDAGEQHSILGLKQGGGGGVAVGSFTQSSMAHDDEDWEDVSEDEAAGMEEDDGDDDVDDDDDDDDDDSTGVGDAGKSKSTKILSATEKFFADL